ncbi:hypothetical protein M569_17352, partial [Genlisea aurea]
LRFDNPITDAISRVRFASSSDNLLISSWDSFLRLYDVDESQLRLEASNDGTALLDCCFESDSVALSADSDGSILRYDLYTAEKNAIGKHDDIATCVEYSVETSQIITAGWDKKVKLWDPRSATSSSSLITLPVVAESISLRGFSLMIGLETRVQLHDLRYSDESNRPKERTIGAHIKCVRSCSYFEGFTVGSVDGRVSVQYPDESGSKNEGYAFRCQPSSKYGKCHLASVNDISFDPSNDGVFATGDSDGYVLVWDTKSRRRVQQ